MSTNDALESVRRQLIILAKRKSAWITKFTEKRPTKWRPKTVLDPKTGDYFTDLGAKEYIIEKLEEGYPLDEVELEDPPGRKGYAMTIKSGNGQIYIKLELGSGVIWGRSFHD